ncbi:hypothetical protein B0T26DRAFT_754679 [Lasiosphaeria miniovina]|uniref:Uncharacterized protein n=1 Tax=Lasiosphaeria miniovina TaxID=1954250 RepID=A0AA40A5F7_9PEZI|nr:uncharacterized protein B0T26DRAFT_754679 [Lasiosphaeria miniovina]KAK0709483.1 hypothetical protein B0T26DRAFT_754679 [Lasiosphaeria miniovina]
MASSSTSRVMPPPPPLLLTKRVTAFLRANLSAHIRAAALTTPAGNLLAHASNLPASALRRQCAVAASLWALHAPAIAARSSSSTTLNSTASTFGDAVESALPLPPPPHPHPPLSPSSFSTDGFHTPRGGSASSSRGGGGGGGAAPAVTVQLDSGAVFVIRRLRCGMLFICMGGPIGPESARSSSKSQGANSSGSAGTSTTAAAAAITEIATAAEGGGAGDSETTDGAAAAHSQSHSALATPALPPAPATAVPSATVPETSPRPGPTSDGEIENGPGGSGTPPTAAGGASAATTAGAGNLSSSSSSAAASGGGGALSPANVLAMRRQVGELGRWLDARLGTLYVPEEGIGIVPGGGGFGGEKHNSFIY